MITFRRSGRRIIAEFTDDWLHSITFLFCKRGMNKKEHYKIIKDYLDRRTKFTGVAICHAEDTFDHKLGKMIAREKLFQNYKSTVKKIASLILEFEEKEHRKYTACLTFMKKFDVAKFRYEEGVGDGLVY